MARRKSKGDIHGVAIISLYTERITRWQNRRAQGEEKTQTNEIRNKDYGRITI